jgi:DNA-binding NarL/FixJ family response regulator
MIKAILVDDHELFRFGVKAVIEKRHPDISIVGEAETGAQFFELLKATAADIVLLDIMLPDTTGIEIARRLKQEYPNLKILAISAENAASIVKEMLDIGIDGFFTKRMGGTDTLAEAIYSIMQGVEFYGQDISDIIYRIYVSKRKTETAKSEFTKTELRVIELCGQGLIGKEVAARLEVNLRTVDTHKKNIFRKLGINTTYEMIQYAVKNGIIEIGD